MHKLRPGDIDIVSSIGDSIAGGNGMILRDMTGILVENRGLVFTTGGDSNWRAFFTLPNILKEYNPNLNGYAMGNSPGYAKSAR